MKWLQWLMDNPMMVVIIGGVLMQMLKAIFGKKDEDQGEEQAEAKDVVFTDPDLAERTRKIREEIQRKIEARARAGAPVQTEQEVERQVATPARVTRPGERDVRREAEILEEQAAMMERLKEAEIMKAAAQRRTEFERATADHAVDIRVKSRQAVLEDLRSPAAMRRAFVLRELLGPPIALRR